MKDAAIAPPGVMPSQQPMRDERFPRHPSDILPAPEEDELKFLSPDQEVATIAVVGKAARLTAGSIDCAIPSGRSGASQEQHRGNREETAAHHAPEFR